MSERVAMPITADEARLLAVIAQRLDRRPAPVRARAAVKRRLLETIEHLGCIQIDTISVISRTHETVLWSRLGPFDPAVFEELYYPDGQLFEYWAHAAAFVPITALPYFLRGMQRYRDKYEGAGSWATEHQELLDLVLARIGAEGPLASRHFERAAGPRPEPWEWWGGKPERRALDHLWSRGDLMVQQRVNFQRVYDLSERLVPHFGAMPLPDAAAERRYFVGTALRALGVATPAWIADYFRTGGSRYVAPREAAAALTAMEETGEAIRVAVAGWEEPVWLARWLLSRLEDVRQGRGRPTLTTLLSPFDNLIWYRPRTERLFGFDYRIECYTPEPKRTYGYYTLPILHRGKLVGRVDPSYDRRRRVLTLKSVHLEPGVAPTERLALALAGAARDLTSFLGGGEIVVLQANPPAFRDVLHDAVGAAAVTPALARA